MGLDMSHDAWHGAYSAFHRFRIEIAKLTDVPLPLMEGFWGGNPHARDIDEVVKKHSVDSAFSPSPEGGYTATRDSIMASLSQVMAKDRDLVAMQSVLEDILPYLPIKWESLKPNPLHTLLSHSDCDGEIRWQECDEIAHALRKLLPKLEVLPDDNGHIGNWKDKTQKMIDGFQKAATRCENIEFR